MASIYLTASLQSKRTNERTNIHINIVAGDPVQNAEQQGCARGDFHYDSLGTLNESKVLVPHFRRRSPPSQTQEQTLRAIAVSPLAKGTSEVDRGPYTGQFPGLTGDPQRSLIRKPRMMITLSVKPLHGIVVQELTFHQHPFRPVGFNQTFVDVTDPLLGIQEPGSPQRVQKPQPHSNFPRLLRRRSRWRIHRVTRYGTDVETLTS